MSPSLPPRAPVSAPEPPRAALPRRDYSAAARWVLLWTLLGLAAYALLHWLWHQPAMRRPRVVAGLVRLPPPTALPVPVEGVEVDAIADTWGAPRGRDRTHQGVDIFAPRGTPVRSTTRGLVTAVRDTGLGGRQVWVLGPGHERHYYAHLENWAWALAPGDSVQPGTPLGTVGTSGNALGTPPHLHYGIYTARGAVDPLPRLRAAD